MNTEQYLIVATTSLSILYGIYRILYKKKGNFRQMRFFLLTSMLLAILLPFNTTQIQLKIAFDETDSEKQEQMPPDISPAEIRNTDEINQSKIPTSIEAEKTSVNWLQIFKLAYLTVSAVCVVRILVQIITLFVVYLRSPIRKDGRFTRIYTSTFRNTFSFFRGIYIHPEHTSDEILAHEKVHARQYHSIDILLIELLAAVMWFNPLVWMMRKEVQLVHEYLADEGALSTGIDKHQYQTLLLNQVSEGRLVHLSSSFNQSLIKKRMTMMTKKKFNQKFTLRIFALIPLAIILFMGIACVNGQMAENEKQVAAIAPTRMNVLYVGVDNPIKVAVSGYKSSELDVSLGDITIKKDNGETVTTSGGAIRGSNGDYIVNPRRPGTLSILVKNHGQIIQETVFRVKTVPDPIVMVAGQKGGTIDKQTLLEQEEIRVVMENFDFDLSFEVTEFTVSATHNGVVQNFKSASNKITDEQKAFIEKLDSGQTIYFQEIMAVGPSGNPRPMSTIALKLK